MWLPAVVGPDHEVVPATRDLASSPPLPREIVCIPAVVTPAVVGPDPSTSSHFAAKGACEPWPDCNSHVILHKRGP